MGYWNSWKPKQVVRFLEKNGFRKDRHKGSHAVFVKEGYTVIIPLHNSENLKIGTLMSIIHQSGLSKRKWRK